MCMHVYAHNIIINLLQDRSISAYLDEDDFSSRYEPSSVSTIMDRQRQLGAQKDLEREKRRNEAEEREHQRQELKDRELQREITKERQRERQKSEGADARQTNSVGLVIGNQLSNPDPVSKRYTKIKVI
jgi:hypothetical protein